MRWPIRNQILVPFAVLLLVTVAATAFGAAWLAGRRAERRIAAGLGRVVESLGDPGRGRFPLAPNVLEMMRGLSGAEFVVLDEDGDVRAGTIEVPAEGLRSAVDRAKGQPPEPATLRDRPTIEHGDERYHVVSIVRPDASGRPVTLVALYPASSLEEARREARWPPTVAGIVLLLATVFIAAFIAGRVARRIEDVRAKVARIADGDFETIDATGTDDEIRALSASVNRMAERLQELQQQVARSERARLLGQLAGGLAHELRNSATGAKLALQLHRKRAAAGEPNDEGLDVALRQLALVEERIKALLSVGRDGEAPGAPGPAGAVLDDVNSLVRATCEHERVTLAVEAGEDARAAVVPDAEGCRSALLNLVLNAIEACGPDGTVGIVLERIDAGANPRVRFDVLDDGPGPDPELGESVFEVFVSTKPEGVGLGLALVRRVAERAGGEVSWSRDGDRTRFRFVLPEGTDA